MSPSTLGSPGTFRCIRPRNFLLACTGIAIALIIAAPNLVAPHDPTNLAAIDLMNAHRPPILFAAADSAFPLGTDEQGRCLLSLVVFGTRTSLAVAIIATAIAAVIGTALGLTAALSGRSIDAVIKRLAELQLSYPAIFVALLLGAVLRATNVEPNLIAPSAAIVIAALALASWPQFALTVRAVARSQLPLDYIMAAISIGQSRTGIACDHLWPAVRGQVTVLALWTAAHAITMEATLSFLGSGLSPSVPSLGHLIRDGQSGLLGGEWWVAGFPLIVVVVLIGFFAATAEYADGLTDRTRQTHR